MGLGDKSRKEDWLEGMVESWNAQRRLHLEQGEKRVWSPEEWDEGQMDRWMANTLGQKPSFSHRKTATELALGAWTCCCHRNDPSINLKLKRRM